MSGSAFGTLLWELPGNLLGLPGLVELGLEATRFLSVLDLAG